MRRAHPAVWASARNRLTGGGGGPLAVWQNPPPVDVDAALLRTLVTPGGPFPRKSAYNVTAPAANTTYTNSDDSDFNGIMAWDAEYSSDPNADCVRVHGSTICGDAVWKVNTRPFRLAMGTSQTGLYIVRGLIRGGDSETLAWGLKKTGVFIQDKWDAGNLVDTASPTSDGNGITLGMKNGGWMALDGVRLWNCMDGVNLRGDIATVANNLQTSGAVCHMKNCYIGKAHDTATTSEQGHLFRAFDCLIDGCYGFIDHRNGPDVSSEAHIWEYCRIRLAKLPGGFKRPSSEMYHNVIDKRDAGISATHHFIGCTIAVEQADEDPLFPTSGLYTGTKLCWLGAGAYPFSVPTGMTLLTGAAATTEWNTQRADWMTRHGMTAWNAVSDYDKLIHAVAPLAA